MTEKLKKVQEFVESLESSSDFESCLVLNPSNDDGNTMGGNRICNGENEGKCTNTTSCVNALNRMRCSNSNYCSSTNSSCSNDDTCKSFNTVHCTNDSCDGTNVSVCTGGQSGGSNNGNSIGFPGFGFM